MRLKVKAAVGMFQCVAAVPSVFDVTVPVGLEEYTAWINLLELPADFGLELIIPGSCFGSYRRRLLISSSWPIVVMLIVAGGLVLSELVRDRMTDNPAQFAPRGKRAAVQAGMERALPFTLIITFLMVPSTSTRIFKTFLCDPFEYDEGNTTMRYLHDDLDLGTSAAIQTTVVSTVITGLTAVHVLAW